FLDYLVRVEKENVTEPPAPFRSYMDKAQLLQHCDSFLPAPNVSGWRIIAGRKSELLLVRHFDAVVIERPTPKVKIYSRSIFPLLTEKIDEGHDERESSRDRAEPLFLFAIPQLGRESRPQLL